MRIRQVKPAFWTDAKLAALPHDARLFYIGLWMLADDEGWLRWDIAQIGAELYGFEPRGSREKRIDKMAAAIQSMPGEHKLEMYPCGHARVPRLAVHQHLAGTTRRVTAIADEHKKCPPPRLPATPRDSAEIPAPYRLVKVGDSDSDGLVGLGSTPSPMLGERPRIVATGTRP